MTLPTLNYEKIHWNQGFNFVCGVDEVGRGCFAGPVVTGAVVLSKDYVLHPKIADSKLLKPTIREELDVHIRANALAWAIGQASVEEINQIGIGKATQVAFLRAVQAISNCNPDFILIDAFYIDGLDKAIQMPIKKGDRDCASIAAASIIAKVYRDKLMTDLDSEYPDYGFARHKGYGTKEHQKAIKEKGLSSLHRTSFNLSKFL